MFIKCKNPDDRSKVVKAIKAKLEESRFTADVFEMNHHQHRLVIRLENIRLVDKKDYCGAHPNECQVNRPHKTTRYLEGGDWIGWNDMLNDVLDRMKMDADAWSYNRESRGGGKYPIRLGLCRRTNYESEMVCQWGRTFFHWDSAVNADDFTNYCGKKAPRSTYPDGTPGLATWRRSHQPV